MYPGGSFQCLEAWTWADMEAGKRAVISDDPMDISEVRCLLHEASFSFPGGVWLLGRCCSCADNRPRGSPFRCVTSNFHRQIASRV